jgi:hypothetical protein
MNLSWEVIKKIYYAKGNKIMKLTKSVQNELVARLEKQLYDMNSQELKNTNTIKYLQDQLEKTVLQQKTLRKERFLLNQTLNSVKNAK